ncbi:hypothetical protein ZYGM_002301 [Zygosaccharomyces mellis]|uniref:N-acetyltransferase domain-containing protein n=1 Tax=Zygosaccharomyces mellis TaxID=42258 RepID=A0A4C2E2D3_9SACH|nr:hypothetical protein ZYGM_002301 [Zygosaccharomyces mellis]
MAGDLASLLNNRGSKDPHSINAVIHDERLYEDQILTPLQPHTILLKDGETVATMYPVPANPELLPTGLLTFLLDEFNMEIEKGGTFPYYERLTLQEFKEVWFHRDGHLCVMVLGEVPELDYSRDNEETELRNNYGTDVSTTRNSTQYKRRKQRKNLNLNIQWEQQCLGYFSIQPAYPGRSAHIVTGNFVVNAGIRGKRIGRTLVETFIRWSMKLGFGSCVFPLIYSTNVGIRRILDDLNFKQIGQLPESGILKGFDVPVNSFIYGQQFTHITKHMDVVKVKDTERKDEIAKYERLKHYILTGTYPPSCDRNEKARIRVNAKHHTLVNGRLYTKGREVILEPQRQQEIALDMHLLDHPGINKLTTQIVEKYHWKGIKSTVCQTIANCPACRFRHPDGVGVVVAPSSPVKQARMLPNMNVDDEMNNSNQLSKVAEAVVGSLQKRGTREHQEEGPIEEEEEDPISSQAEEGDEDQDFDAQLEDEEDDIEAGIEEQGEDEDEDEEGLRVDLENDMTPTDGQMNTFNKFVEQERARKRRKYTISQDRHLTHNNSNSSTPGTVPVIDNSTILSFGDNTISPNPEQDQNL